MNPCPTCGTPVHPDLKIDLDGNGIWYENNFTQFRPRETELAQYLFEHRHTWVTGWDILYGIYGGSAGENYTLNNVQVFMCRLRKEIARAKLPLKINTSTHGSNCGYMLEVVSAG